MVPFAKVYMYERMLNKLLQQHNPQVLLSLVSYAFFFVSLDIDECSADPGPCDENADCTNTDGSYSCNCKQGFDGDGEVCEGKTDLPFL